MTAQQKATLNAVAVWEHNSFPNGSSYSTQKLPVGQHNGVSITSTYNNGYTCTFDDGSIVHVSHTKVGAGGGVNLGKHFCSKDQVLKDLQ